VFQKYPEILNPWSMFAAAIIYQSSAYLQIYVIPSTHVDCGIRTIHTPLYTSLV